MLERLLDLWRREHGADAAGLYLERGGALQQEASAGGRLPLVIDGGAPGRRPRQPGASRAAGSSSPRAALAGDGRPRTIR